MWLFFACAQDDSGNKEEELAPPEGCARVRGGAATGREPAVDLAEALARVRLFGHARLASEVDGRLAAVLLEAEPGGGEAQLGALLESDDCLVPTEAALGDATVEVRGDLAWISPGEGEVVVPDGVAGVVLDLRETPAGSGAAVLAAATAALHGEQPLPAEAKQIWNGFEDQVWSSSNVYDVDLVEEATTLSGSLAEDLPLYVVTGPRIAPEAARMAALLRGAGAAALVGHDVDSAIAEMEWLPIGSDGIAYRARDLALPDLVPADLQTDAPETELAGLPGFALGALEGSSTRSTLSERRPWKDDETVAADTGARRVALLAAHGTMQYFYPYFDVVENRTEASLVAALEGLEADDDRAFQWRLTRYGSALQDGHQFVWGPADSAFVGYAPAWLEHVDGRPVVVHSASETLLPGDVLLAIDGVPVEELGYADDLQAATEGYTEDLVARWYVYMFSASATWTVEGADGEREVEVLAGDWVDALWVPSNRENGSLDDLGAPELAYANLDALYTSSVSEVEELLEADPAGLILDMRGYPGLDAYDLPALFTSESFGSPIFEVPQVSVDGTTWSSEQYELPGSAAPFTGPVVLLVGPHSVSAAENLSQMLVGLGGIQVVGRQSAGTNGNITGIRLAGGYLFTWTGMRVLNPDGSVFHGTGILPDLEVLPTVEDYREGRDPTLEAAVALLQDGD